VAPGPVWTPLNPSDKEAKDVSKFGSDTPMKRPAQPEEIAPAYPATQKAVLSLLYGYGQQVFAVLTSAREDRFPAFLQAYGVDYSSLYEGDGDQLKEAAPYIALLPKTSRLLPLLMKEG
jgi:hypothetical protein